MGVGKSIRSEKENEHISLGTITFREGLEQVRVKRPGGLDLDFALSRFVSHTLCEQFGPQNH